MANEPICAVTYPDGERCERPTRGRRLCSGHWRRLNLYGDPLAGGKLRTVHRKGTVRCNVGRVEPWLDEPECSGFLFSLGFCSKHYSRLQRHGDPLRLAHDRNQDDACTVDGCGRASSSAGAGLCRRHHRRARANDGDPLGENRSSPLSERVQRRTAEGPIPIRFYNHATDAYDGEPPCPCRDWMGAVGYRRGHLTYGFMSVDSVPRAVHRVTYELANGPVAKGLHLDHLCCRPMCCEPLHLEPVTMQENLRRNHLVERAITDRYRDEFFGGTINLRGAEAVAAAAARIVA